MAAPQSGHQTELSRDLGFFAVFTTATGTMIGAGIFILPGVAAASAGPAAALSFLFAGLIAALAALSVCELATAMPKAGGPYYFVSRAMGPALGTIVGLGAWLALILKGSFALVGLGQYVFYFLPFPVLATAAIGGLLLVALNYSGAGVTGLLQNIIVVALLAILAVFVVAGIPAIDVRVLRPLVPFGWSAVASTTGLVFISYLGIVKAAAVAEEVVDPGKVLPRAILGSVALVTVLYVAVMMIVTGVLPLEGIDELEAPLADAAGIFLGVVGAVLVGVAGILATTSTGNSAILSSSRYPFAMARDGLMVRWFSQVHPRFRTPTHAIVVTGGIMVLLALLFDVEQLAKLGGTFGILVFGLVNLSVLILRRINPPWYRPSFRSPFYPVVQILGVVATLALIPQMGMISQIGAAAFILLGVVWFYRQRARMGAENISPEYGLADTYRRIRQIQSIEEKRRVLQEAQPEPVSEPGTVVTELRLGRPNKHLLTVAASIARRFECLIDVVVVTEVPMQAPLSEEVEGPPPAFVQSVQDRLHEHGVEMRFHHVLARNRARAILNLVNEQTHAVLLDWHDEFRGTALRGSHVDQILRESPARVGVLKYRGHKKYERLLVATAGGPYARGEVEFASAVAAHTGATLTLLMVIPPEASPGRRAHAEDYLNQLRSLTAAKTEVRVVEGDSVQGEILRAAEGFDLILLGASRQPLLQNYLFGRIPHKVAAYADQSVLLTKDPGFPQLWPARFPRLSRLFRKRRSATAAAPTPIEPGED